MSFWNKFKNLVGKIYHPAKSFIGKVYNTVEKGASKLVNIGSTIDSILDTVGKIPQAHNFVDGLRNHPYYKKFKNTTQQISDDVRMVGQIGRGAVEAVETVGNAVEDIGDALQDRKLPQIDTLKDLVSGVKQSIATGLDAKQAFGVRSNVSVAA